MPGLRIEIGTVVEALVEVCRYVKIFGHILLVTRVPQPIVEKGNSLIMAGGRGSRPFPVVDTEKFFKFDDGLFNCSGSPFPADGKAWESELKFVNEFQTYLSLLRKGVPLPVTIDKNVASRIERLHHLECKCMYAFI
jgi:hypothetical protein